MRTYDPVRAAEKYRTVIRPAKGHIPGGQGPRRLLSKAEAAAIAITTTLDRHIDHVDQLRIWEWRRTCRKASAKPRGRAPLYSEPERACLIFFRKIRGHCAKAAQKSTCRKCGNDRLVNPDRMGKCVKCRNRLQAARAKRTRKKLKETAEGREILSGWRKSYQRKKTPAFMESRRAHRQRRRARMKGCAVLPIDWPWVLSLYGSKCLRCGKDEATMDHVIPLANGGAHSSGNLQPLCHLCNSTKSATFADYRPFPFYSRTEVALA